jgi:ComF family protein
MRTLLHWAFPPRCVFCDDSPAPGGICQACLRDLPGGGQARCPVCAIDMPEPEVCGNCLRQHPPFQHARSAFSYGFPLDAAIQRLKYAPDLQLAAPLAALLAQAVRTEPRPDLVVPMPASPRRLRSRGFNQAAELARGVAAALALPLALNAVVRSTEAVPQAGLSLAERARNVRGAFRCDSDLSGLRIAVVDDVLTSGASLAELARALRRRGASAVVGWMLARTPRPR